MPLLEAELLRSYSAETPVAAEAVRESVAASGRVLVVLDDDPTGTQSVADLPVLTRWEVADFHWALSVGAPAVYVLTNTRSVGPVEAAQRVREVVANALAAAPEADLAFVSRSDSTLRGHFPLEPEVIAEVLGELAGTVVDGVVVVPAYPDAGRVTIGGTHFVRGEAGVVVPVAATEFARDATFGFTESDLSAYVVEKSAGRYHRSDVIVLDLNTVRGGPMIIADAIDGAAGAAPIVVDIVTENDLRAFALGLAEAERRGKTLLYRVGPPFVRARIGQEMRPPLTAAEVFQSAEPARRGGLVVVGSHVAQTTRQLERLLDGHAVQTVELDVPALLRPSGHTEISRVVGEVAKALPDGDVVLHTTRLLVRATDPAASLDIARTVSAAAVEVVRRTVAELPPRFVLAKGGITSSDVATAGLQIRHALVRGPMLPGIVSLWEPVDGPAVGIPFVVFAGNVGSDDSLLRVVRALSSSAEKSPH